jgi:hypothetical protein
MKEDKSEKFEIPRDNSRLQRNAHQGATKACLGKTEADQEQINIEIKTDLEGVDVTSCLILLS